MRFKKTVLASVLAIGTLVGSTAASAAAYTVTYNDTMWKISQKLGISLTGLINANPQVANPDIIWSGLTLNIPSAEVSAPDTETSASTYADQVVSLVNEQRAEAGLQPLTVDQPLADMALDKAKDMYSNNYFSHTSPTYGSPFDMMEDYGIPFSYAGENIAMGQRTPQEVMTAWMNSEGHRENILNPNFTKIGVASYNNYWVQDFISS
jgi:uncharacterized YkwD family protein